MRKLWIAALCVVLMLMVACGQKEELPQNLDLQEVYQAVAAAQTEAGMDELIMYPETAVELIEIYYPGLFDAGTQNEVLYISEASASEIMLVEAKDEKNIPDIKAVLQARIDREKLENAEGWAGAQVQSKGRYAAMIALPEGYAVPENVFELEPVPVPSATPQPPKEDDEYAAAYGEKAQALAAENGELRFALVDLDGGGVPELVADHPGYVVNVYTWAKGELLTLIDSWPYGAMGNQGYEYVPGGNVIRNYNSDQAGAIVYVSYFMVDDTCEVVSYYDKELVMRHFEDANGNGMLDVDEGETYADEPVAYYWGDAEITAEEYAGYQIPGEYQPLMGEFTAAELLTQLEKK